MAKRQALLLSSSNCYGFNYLEYAKGEICSFFKSRDVKELIFVPYAQNDHDNYTKKVSDTITPWGLKVTGLHTYPDPVIAVTNAKAIFIGGGNTFLLLRQLYENKLVCLIRTRVLEGNLMYMGSSAGTNVATKSIHTTNDMPIAYPPSYDAMGIVNFNINPHYIDTVDNPTHKGETRDERINQFLEMEYANTVLGLREGSILHVNGNNLVIKGVHGAVLFRNITACSHGALRRRCVVVFVWRMPQWHRTALSTGPYKYHDAAVTLSAVWRGYYVGEKKNELPVGADISFLN